MVSALTAANDAARVRAVASYALADAVPDPALDAIVRVAAAVCETPVARISVVGDGRQWYLSSHGLASFPEPVRENAFPPHAIVSPEVTVVEDAARDARFADSPLVLGEAHIRFYAAAPLVDKDGFAIGALCVMDREPRTLPPSQAAVLRELSVAVVRLLEARRAEQALLAAEKAERRARGHLETVLNASPARIAYWDANLVNRFANEAFAEWCGVPRAELAGRTLESVVREELFASTAPNRDAALRGETRRFTRDVAVRPGVHAHDQVTLVPDIQDGVVVGLVSTSTDVTALHVALAASERHVAQLAMAEEMSEVGHWRAEEGTGALYWSPQVYRMHGREPDAFVPTHQSVREAYDPDDLARAERMLRDSMARAEPSAFELRVRRPDGTTRRIAARARWEVDPVTHAPCALFGVYQDVTERDRAREREARQARMVTTGTLAAGVGHEINNPLTYVTANIDFAIAALRGPGGEPLSGASEELVQTLEEAKEGALRIRKIVRGLRLFAHQEAPVGPTEVHAALELAASLSVAELRSCATLRMELEDGLYVLADETRLSQVLVNLLVNAAQSFAERNPEKNHVTIRSKALPGDRVAIEVIDNGCGIPDDVLPRIFDPFFTTKGVGRGSGLGLAISQSMVASFGGELGCTTRLCEGTTFRLVLPAAPAPVTRVPSVPAPAIQAPVRGRILVVDDERTVLRTIERSLRADNDVVSIADPREALRVLTAEGGAFDVVFCDLMMPFLTGAELYAAIAAQDAALASRFVFITGGATEERLRVFLASIPNRCLEKPFDGVNLRQVARDLVRARLAAART